MKLLRSFMSMSVPERMTCNVVLNAYVTVLRAPSFSMARGINKCNASGTFEQHVDLDKQHNNDTITCVKESIVSLEILEGIFAAMFMSKLHIGP